MADARNRAEWGRMSSLLALIANVNRDPKRRPRPFQPSDFDPHAARRKSGGKVSAARFSDEIMGLARGRRPSPSR